MTALLVVGAALAVAGAAAPTAVRRAPVRPREEPAETTRPWDAPSPHVRRWLAVVRRVLLPEADDGLPAALDAIARSLRTGSSLPQAIREAHAVTQGSPLGLVVRDLARGRPVGDSLAAWAGAAERRDHRLAISALLVATDAGGAPARAVDAVAATVRERQDVRREARALAAQARASAVVIAAAPVGFTVLIAGVDPATLGFLLGTPVGWSCVVGGLVLDGLGLWWMLRVLAADPDAPERRWSRRAPRWLVPAVLGAAGLALLGPPAGVVAVAAVLAHRRRRHRRATLRERDQTLRHLPDAIDLLALAIGSGAGVAVACRAVASRGEGPVAEALARSLGQADLGRPLADALDELPARLGPRARPLTAALVAAERDGAPLRSTLERLSAESRAERRRAAEEQARTVPVRLLFPLVACVLPAFALLTVVPLLAGSLRALTA